MIGEFDQVISLCSATKGISAKGESVTTYALFTKAFAKVEIDRREGIIDNQYITDIPQIKVTTHNQSGINTGMRMVYNSTNYDIINISIIDQRKYILITAKIETA
jgi:head-tail adaptor